jgi:23S rRNA pseudouridine1911/1915/1917 synthase
MGWYIDERKMETKQEMTSLRVDHWLRERFPLLTRRQREEALERGVVSLAGGKRLKKGAHLDSREAIDVASLEAHLERLKQGNADLTLELIREFEGYVVVDKPAGMPAHPISLFDDHTLTHWALAHYPEIAREFRVPQPTVVPHRLDTGTSGLQIICRRKVDFEQWRERFARHEVTKRYLAWAWGIPSWTNQSVECELAHSSHDDRKMLVALGEKGFRGRRLPSLSEIRVLRVDAPKNCFFCEVTCRTGVRHQVRVHLSSLGFPLVGDVLYDEDAAGRTLQPPHHQLRAVGLEYADLRFEAEAQVFSKFSDIG